ncbi:hypothetical protein ACUXMM_001098 [Micrococcus aloeverae]
MPAPPGPKETTMTVLPRPVDARAAQGRAAGVEAA